LPAAAPIRNSVWSEISRRCKKEDKAWETQALSSRSECDVVPSIDWITKNHVAISGRIPVVVTNFILAVSLAAIWIAFAPARLGGKVAYVINNNRTTKTEVTDTVILQKIRL
jgi:hypothetical protein